MKLALPEVARPRRWLLALYVASAALVTIQQAVVGHSNNFRVFRSATLNLLAGRDLYAAHPEQHFDFYKYSPTFALLFAPFAYLPFALAFLCWSLLNALLLWYALDRLLPQRPATLALALVYLEVLLAMQYGQSNSLVAALGVLAFVALERGRQPEAAAEIALGASIKLFPVALLPIAVFHPRRVRFGLMFVGAAAALVALPLLAVPAHELAAQYRSWRAIEAADTLNRGYSLMQYLYMWFGADWPNWPVQLAGTALLLLPLAIGRARWGDAEFRRLFLCSVLVYMVLFNHQSERATFVIAYAGIVIWYVSSPPSRLRTAVMALTLLVMVIHDVEIVPYWVKKEILIPYRIKGIPCLVAWFVIQGELLTRARRSESDGSLLAGTAPEPRLT
ncbi:MAG TPA: glycosyltransferase family 87 protein [Gemmatimonadales bacterium]|nr:glycosyltransferase family 87 protein [Gemmatimonadales bacterium]